MDNYTFGITLTVIGMGGTFVTMWIIIVGIHILRKIYPGTKN